MYGKYKELSGKDIIHLLEKFVGQLGNTSEDIIEDRIASGRRILTTETHRIIISQTGVTVIYTTEQGKTVTTVSFSIKTPDIIYKHIISGYKNGGSIMKSFINDEWKHTTVTDNINRKMSFVDSDGHLEWYSYDDDANAFDKYVSADNSESITCYHYSRDGGLLSVSVM